MIGRRGWDVLAVLVCVVHGVLRVPYMQMDMDDAGRDLYVTWRVLQGELPLVDFEFRGFGSPILYAMGCKVLGGVTALHASICINFLVGLGAWILFKGLERTLSLGSRWCVLICALVTTGGFHNFAAMEPYAAWPFATGLFVWLVRYVTDREPRSHLALATPFLLCFCLTLVKYNQGVVLLVVTTASMLVRPPRIAALLGGAATVAAIGAFYGGLFNLFVAQTGLDVATAEPLFRHPKGLNFTILHYPFTAPYALGAFHNQLIFGTLFVGALVPSRRVARWILASSVALEVFFVVYLVRTQLFFETPTFFPTLCYHALVLTLVVVVRFRKEIGWRAPPIQISAAVIACLFAQVELHEYYLHWQLAYKVLPWTPAFSSVAAFALVEWLASASMAAVLGPLFATTLVYYHVAQQRLDWPLWDDPTIGVHTPMSKETTDVLEAVASYVAARTEPTDPVLVLFYEPLLNVMMQRRVLGYSMQYTTASLPPPWGVSVNPEIERTMAELERHPVPYVIVSNRRSETTPVHPGLVRTLTRLYTVDRVFGRAEGVNWGPYTLSVLKRSELP